MLLRTIGEPERGLFVSTHPDGFIVDLENN